MTKAKRILALVLTGTFLLQPALHAGAAGINGQVLSEAAAGNQVTVTQAGGISVEARFSSNHIRFDAVEGATGYNILRAAEEAGEYAQVNAETISIAADQASYSYIDETAGTGTQYWYKVEAVKDGGNTEVGPAQDQYKTGISAVHEHAKAEQFHRDFVSGSDMAFSGDRIEKATAEEVGRIKSMDEGSIIVTHKPAAAAADRKVLLTFKNASAATPASGDVTNGMAFFQQSAAIRLDMGTALRATYAGAATVGSWNTYALVNSAYTAGEKNVMTSLNGSEMTGWSREDLSGFFSNFTDPDTLSIGAAENGGQTVMQYNGEIAYVTITDELFSQKEINAYTRAVTLSLTGNDIAITDLMLSTMYDDTHWVFVGGEAVSAGYDHVGSIRNYVGQYEEYIRWGRILSTPINNRQRFVINSGKEGRTLDDIVTNYDKLVTAFHPRVVAYMVGKEDYAAGDEGIEAFKTNLKAFIDKTLVLKEAQNDFTFAVIQKPFAVSDASANTMIEKYCAAVDEVVGSYDETKAKKIVVADHFTQTNNDAFKNSKLSDGSRLNVDGHYEIGKQLATVAFGDSSGYWGSWIRNTNHIRQIEEQPETYLTTVKPAVTAGADSLDVTVPDGNGTEWAYELDMDGILVTGEASSNSFKIPNLTAGKGYVLKIRSADGTKQLCTMKGSITAGNTAVENTQELDANQQRLAEMMAEKDSMTWLFMGDSITHGAQFTAGYDSIPQLFEKFLRDELGRKDDTVVNAAVANGNTISTLEHIYQRLEKYSPDVVSIMLGTNDAYPGVAAIDVYEQNMREIIRRIKALNSEAVIIIRTPTYSWDTNRINSVPQYTARLKTIVDEDQSLIYIDQLSWGEKYVGTYSWLRTLNGQYLYLSDSVHPDGNGHLIMFRQFVKGVGLWTEDSRMTNLSYVMPVTDVEVGTVPALDTSVLSTISLSVPALKTASGLSDLGAVALTATIKETGQSFTAEVEDGTEEAALSNLPIDTDYTVAVSGYRKNEAKRVTFASQDVRLQVPALTFDIQLSTTEATVLTAGSTVGELSVNAGAPAGTYTYSLAEGEGSADNSKFMIEGTTLKISQALQKGQSYSIRIKAVNGDLEQEKSFTIQAVGTAVDLSGLEALIEEARKKKEADYTAESWERLADILAQAEEVVSNSAYVEQAMVDTAKNGLQAALDSLEEKEMVKAPVFSPEADTYTEAQSVTITSATPDAEIYYTTDGTTPTTSSERYAAAIKVDKSMTIKAVAVKAGMKDSEVVTAAYTINASGTPEKETVATPVITPGTNTYTEAQSVTITTATPGAEIYYTTDGSVPTASSTKYAAAIKVDKSMTIKAVAIKAGMNNSDIAEATYTINIQTEPGQVAAPTFGPAAGTYPESLAITISTATEGAEIYYTVNGADPTASSTKYTGPFEINRRMVIRAIAIKEGMESSEVAKAAYVMDREFPFTDVEQNGLWKHKSVKYVWDNSIMNGISGTTLFDPDSPLTRAMFATVLYRMAGEPGVEFTDKFPDVAAGKWYSDAIIWANQQGIVQGMGDGNYGINENITREQIAKMLYEYAKATGYDISETQELTGFTDAADVSGWAVGYMKWATAVEMITGKPNEGGQTYRMDPKGEATRAECAAMLMRFEDKYIPYE